MYLPESDRNFVAVFVLGFGAGGLFSLLLFNSLGWI